MYKGAPAPSVKNYINKGSKIGAKAGQILGGALLAPVGIATLPIYGTEFYLLENAHKKKVERKLCHFYQKSEGRGMQFKDELEESKNEAKPLDELMGSGINKIPSLFDRGVSAVGSLTRRICGGIVTAGKSLLKRQATPVEKPRLEIMFP